MLLGRETALQRSHSSALAVGKGWENSSWEGMGEQLITASCAMPSSWDALTSEVSHRASINTEPSMMYL